MPSPFLARLNQENNCRAFLELIRDEACRRLEAEMASVFLWPFPIKVRRWALPRQ